MSEPQPDERFLPVSPRARRAAVVYWVTAAAIYIALGVLAPYAFLLGFQEALLYVFLVTILAPKVLRRFE